MLTNSELRWEIGIQNQIIDGLYKKIARLEKELAVEKSKRFVLKSTSTTRGESKVLVEFVMEKED